MRYATILTTVALLTLGACGDDTTAEDPEMTLREAVETYTEAFGNGDAETVISMVSPRCLTELGATSFRQAVNAIKGPLEITSYDEDIDGDTASVSYSVNDPTLSQSDQRWSLIDGTWHWDNC